MLDLRFKVNPPAREISHCSTVLNGIATRYRVDSYRTTLCVKAVQRGSALYATPKAKHLVTEDSFLILNEGQVYSLDFSGPGPTETLCPFFQPGCVELVTYCLHAIGAASGLPSKAAVRRLVDVTLAGLAARS